MRLIINVSLYANDHREEGSHLFQISHWDKIIIYTRNVPADLSSFWIEVEVIKIMVISKTHQNFIITLLDKFLSFCAIMCRHQVTSNNRTCHWPKVLIYTNRQCFLYLVIILWGKYKKFDYYVVIMSGSVHKCLAFIILSGNFKISNSQWMLL